MKRIRPIPDVQMAGGESWPPRARIDGRPELTPAVITAAHNLLVYDEAWQRLRQEYAEVGRRMCDTKISSSDPRRLREAVQIDSAQTGRTPRY